MRAPPTFRSAAFSALLLTLACAEAPPPEAPPPPDVVGTAPTDAVVHAFQPEIWKDAICAGRLEWTWDVPTGAWITVPVGWMAVDEATARQNWEHMSFELLVGGRPLAVPRPLEIRVDSLRFECPDQVFEGVSVGPVVYVPPLEGERTYTMRYVFSSEVNDGWASYGPQADLVITLVLRPAT